MLNTMKEFENALDTTIASLREVERMNLLNDEGIRTLKAYSDLAFVAAFYDDFSEYAEDAKVQKIFSEYEDCSRVKHAHWFLNKKINENS